MKPRIRVLIVDDHAVVREGLNLFLGEESDEIDVVGEAADGVEAVEAAKRLKPDVVLMDVLMPRRNGIEALREMGAAGLGSRVLMLTTFSEDTQVHDAIQAGAIGYLLKDVSRPDLLAAIRAAADGKPTLHPEAQARLMRKLTSQPEPSPLDELTDRERDVLRLIARGSSNKAIAKTLFLSVGTVKGYVSAILAKLGVTDRTQAALLAVRHGLGEE
ncbi:MAG TPA: response regulator transcription factor [Longimicrobiales bacterium]|nr:response regulator transcription factor [Longimicrobiales bacterium]